MSALLFLSNENFGIRKEQGESVLCNNIKGFSLILFYSTQCKFCKDLIPVFKKLPGTIGGCTFGMINVSNNKQCVNMSLQTKAPIKYVPFIVLYVDGRPLVQYDGKHTISDIRQFVLDTAKQFRLKRNFTKSFTTSEKPKIPAYCTGQPVCSDGVCYVDFKDAYNK